MDARFIVVTLLHLLALAVLPTGFQWVLATAFPVAALLRYQRPNDQGETTPYVLGLIGVSSALALVYKVLAVLSADTPDPEGAMLYSFALWALGLAGVTYLGYLVYVIRYIFWERTGPLFGPRARSEDVLDQIKRS